jgi:hypothetical protein
MAVNFEQVWVSKSSVSFDITNITSMHLPILFKHPSSHQYMEPKTSAQSKNAALVQPSSRTVASTPKCRNNGVIPTSGEVAALWQTSEHRSGC